MGRGSDEDLDRQLDAISVLGVICVVCFGLVYLGLALRWRTGVNVIVPVVVACGVGSLLRIGITRMRARRERRSDWRARRHTCHHCGYDLKGLKPPVRCPECGKPHLPRVA